jgi:hypothetical protein
MMSMPKTLNGSEPGLAEAEGRIFGATRLNAVTCRSRPPSALAPATPACSL